jgi:hypothetical protein
MARRVLWSLLAAVLALTLAGLFFRDALASFGATRLLAQRGFHCDPLSVHVPLMIPPANLQLEPSRCKVSEGPLESVLFTEPVSLHLEGFEVRSLAFTSLEINLRPAAAREVDRNTLGDMSRIVGLDQPALELMFDSAKLSRGRNPSLEAGHAVLRRAGKQVAGFRDLRVATSENGSTISSPHAHLDQAALLGEGALRLTATPTAAVFSVVFAGDLKVKIVLDHIDATRPTADFSVAIGSTTTAAAK